MPFHMFPPCNARSRALSLGILAAPASKYNSMTVRQRQMQALKVDIDIELMLDKNFAFCED